VGRPRMNLAFLQMSGTAQAHPGRYEDRGPEPETKGPIGDPPADFLRPGSGDALKLAQLWCKLVDEAPIGLLTVSDREYLEAVCRIGVESKRPGRGQARALEQYGKMLKGLGMTPEGRAVRGLGGKAPTKAANPLHAFRQQRQRAVG
jgi:hypothetical protein